MHHFKKKGERINYRDPPSSSVCGITDLLELTTNTHLHDVAEHKELHSNLINT